MAIAEFYDQKPKCVITMKEEKSDYYRGKQKSKKREKSKLLGRIPLKQLMDLKIDYAFKQLFGSNEKNKDITVVFLNAILQKTGRNRIKDISFTNTETGGEYANDKQSRLDLLVVTDANEWINVEVQFTDKYDMLKRSIFYWSRTYLNPLEKGDDYQALRPVIAINILNFDLFDQTKRFHTSYHLYEDEDQFKLTDVMEFHYIEMSKLIMTWKDDKLDPWNSVLARWLLLLGMVDHRNKKVYEHIYEELEVIAMEDESLRDAFQTWEELSMTPEQRHAYESRLKRIMDEEAFQSRMERLKLELEEKSKEIEQQVKEAAQQSKEADQQSKEAAQQSKEAAQMTKQAEHKIKEADKRIKESENKAKESIAHRLLSKGIEVEIVSESTDLAMERVIEIQQEIKN